MYIQTLIRVLLLMSGMAAAASAQSYRHQLEEEWKKAEDMVSSCHEAWEEIFSSLDADSGVCEAIVFPEILRWSKLKDIFEQAALRDRYVREGTAGADFSIGYFQMKPSFAEKVEKAWMKSPLRHEYGLFFDLQDTDEARRQRIARLSDEKWQCVYVAVFVRLILQREPSIAEMPHEEQISMLATAYNRDFHAPADSLRRWTEVPTFHLDIIPSKATKYYPYAAIAVEYGHMTER